MVKKTPARAQSDSFEIANLHYGIPFVAGWLWTLLVWFAVSDLTIAGGFDNPILVSPLASFIIITLLPAIILFIAAEVSHPSPWRRILRALSLGVITSGAISSLGLFWIINRVSNLI